MDYLIYYNIIIRYISENYIRVTWHHLQKPHKELDPIIVCTLVYQCSGDNKHIPALCLCVYDPV